MSVCLRTAKAVNRRYFLTGLVGLALGAAGGVELQRTGESVEIARLRAELALAQSQLAAQQVNFAVREKQYQADNLQWQARLAVESRLRQVEQALYSPLTSTALDTVATTIWTILREEHRVERSLIAGIRQAIELLRTLIREFFVLTDAPLRILGRAVEQLENLLAVYVEACNVVRSKRDEILVQLNPAAHWLSEPLGFVTEHDPTGLLPRLVDYVRATGNLIDQLPEQMQQSILAVIMPIREYLLSDETGLEARIFRPLETQVFVRVLQYLDYRQALIERLESTQLHELDQTLSSRRRAVRAVERYQSTFRTQFEAQLMAQAEQGLELSGVLDLIRQVSEVGDSER